MQASTKAIAPDTLTPKKLSICAQFLLRLRKFFSVFRSWSVGILCTLIASQTTLATTTHALHARKAWEIWACISAWLIHWLRGTESPFPQHFPHAPRYSQSSKYRISSVLLVLSYLYWFYAALMHSCPFSLFSSASLGCFLIDLIDSSFASLSKENSIESLWLGDWALLGVSR